VQLILKKEIDSILSSRNFLETFGVDQHTGEFNFQVYEPDDPQYGFLATNAAFIFAKKFKELHAKVISPQAVAEKIKLLFPKDKFSAVVDGGGFVNFNPTSDFTQEFLTTEKNLELKEIFVDWSAKAVIDNFFSPPPEEVTHLIQALKKSGKLQLTHDDSLQLLSLLGDSELDASAYIAGYGSRTNTPFYLSHFFEVTSALKINTPCLETPFEFQALCNLIMLFRGRVLSAAERNHPERVLNLALGLVREFLAIYNRPSVRASLSHNFEVLMLAQHCRNFSISTLNALKFSCELPVVVL